MLAFLKKSYPFIPFSSKDLLTHVWIGCFIFLFLWIFQPFGITIWQTPYKVWKLAGFGFVSFLCPTLMKLFFSVTLRRFRPEETWQVWKEVLAVLLTLLCIAFGCLLFANAIHLTPITLHSLAGAFIATLLIGIFPVVANVIIKYNRFLVLNQKEAETLDAVLQQIHHPEHPTEQKAYKTTLTSVEVDAKPEITANEQETVIPTKEQTLRIVAENEKDRFTFNPHQLFYIESADNYSELVYSEGTVIKKELFRSSLKRLETQLESCHYIVRCHRSYMINLLQADHVSGNAQGYRITLKDKSLPQIPVSRQYSKAIFDRLNQLQHLKSE